MNMVCTPELRWVERWLNYNPITGETFLHPSPVKILQQKWLDEAIPPTDEEITGIVRDGMMS